LNLLWIIFVGLFCQEHSARLLGIWGSFGVLDARLVIFAQQLEFAEDYFCLALLSGKYGFFVKNIGLFWRFGCASHDFRATN